MGQVTNLKVTGLNTNPSEFGARGGSLKIAKNINVDSPNTASSRRGSVKYGYPLSETGSGTFNDFFNYEDKLMFHHGSNLYKDDGSGGWDGFTGSYTAPDSEIGIRSIENNGSFFFTTDAGIYKLDDIGNTPALAGIPRAIGMDLALSGTSGFFTADTQVAYRVVWGKTDTNGIVSLGFPSERGEIANVSTETGEYTETRDVALTLYIPTGITTSYFYQVYRSGFSASKTTVANDELQLVYENNPTAAQISAGSISFTDNTPDSLRGATIYTAPTQEGIGQANELPPLAKDCTAYKGYAMYANTYTRHSKYITLLAVGGDGGIDVDDTITIGGITFTAKATQTHASGEFAVVTTGTAAENIADTAQSLVQVINRYTTNTVTYAYYTSGYDELPGEILIQRRDLTNTAFDITWLRNSTGGNLGTMWNPVLSTVAVSSDNETKPNRIYVSKYNQFDAVPILQHFDAGASNSAIKRILSLRDSVFALKDNGEIWRLTGTDINSFQLVLFDNTTKLIGAKTATVFNNQVFCFSEQGVVAISDSGVSVKSWDIEDKLKTFFGSSTFPTTAFAVTYESDRKYILYTGAVNNDESVLVYNSFTNSWSTWDITAEAGFVNPTDDKLYWGKSDDYVYKERKNFDKFDFADDEYDVTIVASSGTTVSIITEATPIATQSLKQSNTSSYVSTVTQTNIDYTSTGTDQSLDTPSLTDTATALIPMQTIDGGFGDRYFNMYVGEYYWRPDEFSAVGATTAFLKKTGGTQTAYGQIAFKARGVGNVGGNWQVFADATNNGTQTITFALSTGSFTYYYHKAAWTTAFSGNESSVIVAQNGSVYKGSIATANLVVDFAGNVGTAGGTPSFVGNEYDLTVEDSTVWYTGAATVNDFIDCELQWLEIYGNNPGIMKKFKELTVFFRNMNDKFKVKFNNNFDAVNTVETTITPVVVGSAWGAGTWGNGPWGGTGQANTEQRTYFPPPLMRALWVNVMFETNRAFTQFSLNAVSMVYEMMDTEFTNAGTS